MKKLIFSIALLSIVFLTKQAAGQAYQKGQKLLNANVGIGAYKVNVLGSLLAEKLKGAHSTIGFGASFEVGITDQISAGGLFGYSRDADLEMNFLHVGARASYHLAEQLKINNDKLDLYAGAGLGYRIMSGTGYTSEDYEGLNKIFIPVHVGGRYYFNNNLAGFAELGTGFAILQTGITVKF